jgi:hypothetical protein
MAYHDRAQCRGFALGRKWRSQFSGDRSGKRVSRGTFPGAKHCGIPEPNVRPLSVRFSDHSSPKSTLARNGTSVVDSTINGGSDTTKGSTNDFGEFSDARVTVTRESTLVTSNP